MIQADPVKITGLSDITTTLKNSALVLGQIQQAILANTAAITANTAAIATVATALAAAFPPPKNASAAWTPGAVASGAQASTTVTIAGVVLGNYVLVAASVDLQDQILIGYVSAANTVTVLLQNNTASPITLGTISVNVRVYAN